MPDKVSTGGTGSGQANTQSNLDVAHSALVSMGLLFAFVILLTIMANSQSDLSTAAVAIVVILLIIQGMTHTNLVLSVIGKYPNTQ